MKPPTGEDLEDLVAQVRKSARYSGISADVVRTILVQELDKRASFRDAVKATRNKLHQVGTVYQDTKISYLELTTDLEQMDGSLNDLHVQEKLKRMMKAHASTRERLPILEQIYATALAPIAPVHSVLDIACGLNPFTIPWMPLSPSFTYHAVDIFSPMIDLINVFFNHFHINGQAEVADVLHELPSNPVQLALILKTIPCLEQLDKKAGEWLLDKTSAENLLVSFPAHSLQGRSKGMVQNYEAHFRDLTSGKPWKITRYEFPGELVFLVQK